MLDPVDSLRGLLSEVIDALAQPEQEPRMYRIWNDKDAQWLPTNDCSWPAEPLYTIPPKRPWVGLTDDERSDLVTAHHGWNEYGQAIESILKEKNT